MKGLKTYFKIKYQIRGEMVETASGEQYNLVRK